MGSTIWKWPHRHPRSLQVSGTRISLALRFQETSRGIFLSARSTCDFWITRANVIFYNWWREVPAETSWKNIKKLVSVKPLSYSNESCQNRLKWLGILEMLWSVIRLIWGSQRGGGGGPFDGWRLKISLFDGWWLDFWSFDGWRLIFRKTFITRI